MLGYLLQGLTLGLSAAATPGPYQAYLLSQTVKGGWRRALPAAFAPLLSDGPIVALVLLVLTQTPAAFLKGLQVAGGLFILYLARGAYLAFRHYSPTLPPSRGSDRHTLGEATLMNLLNPNPYIFWSLIGGPILLDAWRRGATLGLAFLAGMYLALIGGLIAVILLFASASRLAPTISRWLIALSAVALALFGCYQLWLGVTGLLAPA